MVALAACGPALKPFPEPDRPPPMVPDLSDDRACANDSISGLTRCIEDGYIERDIRRIALHRPPGSPHHAAVQALCAERLAGMGFEMEVMRYGSGTNVIGVKPGFSKPGERVVLGAHYDQVQWCDGADDNASGVAVLLELARVLSQATFDRTLVVACWDEGEREQRGSRAYAERARSIGERVAVALCIEAVGYASSEPDSQRLPERFEEVFPDQALSLLDNDYRGDFLALVSEAHTDDYAAAATRASKELGLPLQILRLTEAQKRKVKGDMHVSDHVSFWNVDVPAMLFTDSGRYRNPNIGCTLHPDAADTLDYVFTGKVARAALAAAVTALQIR